MSTQHTASRGRTRDTCLVLTFRELRKAFSLVNHTIVWHTARLNYDLTLSSSLSLLSSLLFQPTVAGVGDEGDGSPDVWQQAGHEALDGVALRGVSFKPADQITPTLQGRTNSGHVY